ncbi:GspE/PulE family protein [Shewanella colwelliana]|uniref:GspE/PulE family protein n=1 Tax=Shewanella colwelliana TaxID=23 RepID=UPI003736980A
MTNPLTSESEELTILLDPELTRLCLDDGFTFVTQDGEVKTANPKSAPKLDDIAQFVKAMPMMVGKDSNITQTTQKEVDLAIEIMTSSSMADNDDSQDSELSQFFTGMCQAAVNASASDVHIEIDKELTRFLIRVDGKREVLKRLSNGQSALHQPRKLGVTLASYVFATLGRQDIKLSDPANDRFSLLLEMPDGKSKLYEWRVALIPLDHGAKMTLRCLTGEMVSLEQMDLPDVYLQILQKMVQKRGGAIVVCGPMGSGKSTLITALIDTIDRVARSVHSLEDPVEFEQKGVCKTPVEPKKETKVGSGFYRDYAFYAIETLRHDVDVSALGEVREREAAKEFCRKAETGGLALTTLHTNSALGVPQTFTQHLGIPAAVVGAPGLMLMFVHQKLVRKLCPCALPLTDAKSIYEQQGLLSQFNEKHSQLTTLLNEHAVHAKVINPAGCRKCKGKGEKGRIVVMEIIVLDDTDRQFIAKEDDHGWKKHLEQQGWPDIRAHTLSRLKRGQVDITSASEQVDGLIPENINQLYQEMGKELSL